MSSYESFLISANDKDNISVLESYVDIAESLLYQPEHIIRSVTGLLKDNIIDWATKNSVVYKDHTDSKIYTRTELDDKDNWYTKQFADISHTSRSSGSTTGRPFEYRIPYKFTKLLQDTLHWDLILREFNIKKSPSVCVLYPQLDADKTFFSKHDLDTISNQHFDASGISKYNHGDSTSKVSFINFNLYTQDPNKWHVKVLEFLSANKIDIIISTGPIINTLKNHINKTGFKDKICSLLSHSNEFPIYSDFTFLKEHGIIENYCDHMRCWDGGATFFTCTHNTYHLMDNVSWCYENEQKLISTDYFSLSAPFINYWNGDLCEIQNEYRLCKCGRRYRPFKMLQNRPFALKGSNRLNQIRKEISELNFKSKISQFSFQNMDVHVFTNEPLNKSEKDTINCVLKGYSVHYHQ